MSKTAAKKTAKKRVSSAKRDKPAESNVNVTLTPSGVVMLSTPKNAA